MMSLPSRERGLKSDDIEDYKHLVGVAPLAGAWIEIERSGKRDTVIEVAPLAGAWIEIV